MRSRTELIRSMVDRKKGQQEQLEKNLQAEKDKLRDARRSLDRHEKAREIIRIVGLETQKQLEVHISDVTSLALEDVFDNPYELSVEFVQRRNKTECDLLFKRNDSLIHPLDSSGYGSVDIASLALRIASWSMQSPRRRNTIILDEPLRFLSEEYQERASQMIKELSSRLGIQFIIITHNVTLAEYADKLFRVRLKNGKSIII